MVRLDLIVGARPNFIKAAPVLEALRARKPGWDISLIHTGQHYDEKLSNLFFRQLAMPAPDVNLGVGSGTHTVQTARVMLALEEQFLTRRPDLVMVYGDINSTLAAALVASKLGIRLAHVEAGLRSFDRTMPEEINRVLTDSVSDLLFTTEPAAEANLRHEGIAPEQIHFVGNTMIDTLLKHRASARALEMPARMNLAPGGYAVVTLHRPSNVDAPAPLQRILNDLIRLAHSLPVIFPVHPRTAQRLRDQGLWESVAAQPNLRLCEPLGYLEFVGLMADAALVLTDSGGIQEETTILGVPCITLRSNTERPVTLTDGTNVLVGNDSERLFAEADRALRRERATLHAAPEKWDGQASARLVDLLERYME